MTDASGSTRKPNRGPAAADANRRALLAAARDLFGSQGLSVPLSAIAQRAGVGQGSLYRHFPSRTAIAAAVFDENLGEIEVFLADPSRTLDDVFDVLVEQAMASAALIDLIIVERHDPDVERLGARFGALIAQVLDRDRARGTIASWVEIEDIQVAVGMLAGELARTDEADRAALAGRVRRIFRNGIAHEGAEGR